MQFFTFKINSDQIMPSHFLIHEQTRACKWLCVGYIGSQSDTQIREGQLLRRGIEILYSGALKLVSWHSALLIYRDWLTARKFFRMEVIWRRRFGSVMWGDVINNKRSSENKAHLWLFPPISFPKMSGLWWIAIASVSMAITNNIGDTGVFLSGAWWDGYQVQPMALQKCLIWGRAI